MTSLKRALTYFSLVISSGFAIFSMFFGSGNLVFPLSIGQKTGDAYIYGLLGLFFTGVLLPFLGLLTIFLFKGSYKPFFQKLDKRIGLLLPIIILSLMGPLAVIPRCITVSFGSFQLLTESVSLWQFSLINCIVIYLFSFDKGKIIPLLGNVLTPILLFSLFLIIYYGIIEAPTLPSLGLKKSPFVIGVHGGYQMMDLLAAFFLSATVISYLKNKLSRTSIQPSHRQPIIFSALLLGALFLGITYGFLIYLGGAYSEELKNIPTEQGITYIAFKTLGQIAGPMVATAVTLACLTTAIVLTSVVGEFYQKTLLREKVPLPIVSLGVITVSFFISTLEFQGIASYLGPILLFLYPGVIIMTLLSIAQKLFNTPYPTWIVYLVFFFTFLKMVL